MIIKKLFDYKNGTVAEPQSRFDSERLSPSLTPILTAIVEATPLSRWDRADAVLQP